MSLSWAETCRQVVARANGRCAYCRMHQSLQGATFHVEHVIPQSEGGKDSLENLCLACPSCNLHKSNLTTAVDPESGQRVPLFRPGSMRWGEYFEWVGFRIAGRTASGRATIELLELNSERRLRIREAESLFELFPPAD
jgi:hypothetical protein